MLSTFINENMNVAYPFTNVGSLPFPGSCITGIQIACCYDTGASSAVPGMLYVSSITFSKDSAYLIVCSADGTPLAAMSAYKRGLTGTSTMIQNVHKPDSIYINGFVELGIIPESAYGLHTGVFWLDPSCVSFVPQSVMRKDKHKININYRRIAVGQCLSLYFSGVLDAGKNASNYMITVNSAVQDMDLYTMVDEPGYSMITTLNGIDTTSEFSSTPGTSLEITSGSDDVELDSVKTGSCIIVTVKGNSQFKNCFGDADEADSGDDNDVETTNADS